MLKLAYTKQDFKDDQILYASQLIAMEDAIIENEQAQNITFDNTTTGMTATNTQDAINELFTNVSEGKALVAEAVTGKGVETASDSSFETIATNIGQIESGSSNSRDFEQVYVPIMNSASTSIYLYFTINRITTITMFVTTPTQIKYASGNNYQRLVGIHNYHYNLLECLSTDGEMVLRNYNTIIHPNYIEVTGSHIRILNPCHCFFINDPELDAIYVRES